MHPHDTTDEHTPALNCNGGRTTVDMTGKRYGRVTVLRFGGYSPTAGGSTARYAYFICQCDCGTVKPVRARSLANGHSNSCGCLQSERSRENVKKAQACRRMSKGVS